ncbi:MAG: rRNA maturation RNase YbeY [Proteobacteria bacterium]|nr:rRNA maturation RNase YbeY [Pseudomonadota bacterium]
MSQSTDSEIATVHIQLAPEVTQSPDLHAVQAVFECCLQALVANIAPAPFRPLSGEICVRLCAEAESQFLNSEYRKRDKPTNVLSFAANDAATAPLDVEQQGLPAMPLGDLAICWPIVQVEAAEQDKDPLNHLTHLFAHGVLHLLGFDHQADREAQAMEAIECRTLAQMGIANPYTSEVEDA